MRGEQPEYNSVDASLWYVVAAHEFLTAAEAPARGRCPAAAMARSTRSSRATATGTRFGIRMAEDGLLAAGEPGVQLTWMDAKVGDWVVTPRIGKPVEVQALWINALRIAGERSPGLNGLAERALASFRAPLLERTAAFCTTWSTSTIVCGRNDASLRPNQIFAVGGLPLALLEPRRGRAGGRRGRAAAADAPRAALARARRARLSGRTMGAACASATAPITRARSGPG